MHETIILVSRLLLGVPFVIWGIMKLRGGEAKLVPVLKRLHLPDAKALAYLVGICELVGGLGVIVGWPLALFGTALGLWCLATAYIGHRDDVNALLSHVAMAGGFFLVASVG
ncbi:DoxX family protein [Paracoccus aurantiacus]|uniref:DoxX family protein n=1 Tax=Paracoccus aurantiacus TaxID=2599412 RepID=A0A5C6S8B8_9RHOB|nr:DoxX family protein [Paracoccus aurantiacus]TXB70696.1 DoxX family protein [Paracoccus aurantiacus]